MVESKLNKIQVMLVVVVAAMWSASFFIPQLDATARVGVQAAMMLILGAIFGIKLVQNGGADK